MTGLLPIEFTPPELAAQVPYGLYSATTFIETVTGDAARRWLPSGVLVNLVNFGHSDAAGNWAAAWDAGSGDLTEDDVKSGDRADISDREPWTAQTLYGFDRNNSAHPSELNAVARAEIKARAQRALLMNEQPDVEKRFAESIIDLAGSPTTKLTLIEAVAALEETIAPTSTVALVHARAGLLAVAEAHRMIVRDPSEPGVLRTPAGHRWVFGAGYAAASLGNTLIATSPVFGWRDEVAVRDALHPFSSQYVAIAERSVLIATEQVIGATQW